MNNILKPILYCFFLPALFINLWTGCSYPNKAGTKPKGDSATAVSKELKRLFEIPVKKGSLLSTVSDDNADCPEDFQYFNNKIYLLSGEEKKVIYYDIDSGRLHTLDKIDRMLTKDKKWVKYRPKSIRVTEKYIIIGFDFYVLVFSRDQNFLYQIDLKQDMVFTSVKGDTLYLWNNYEVRILVLASTTYSAINTIKHDSTPTYLYGEICEDGGNIINENKEYSIQGGRIEIQPVKEINYSAFHGLTKENVSLNCVTSRYFVWYPWKMGNHLFFTDRASGSFTDILLNENIGESSLSYSEDVTGGLKMAGHDDRCIYIMIMKNETSEKKIIVYEYDF